MAVSLKIAKKAGMQMNTKFEEMA